MDLINPDFGFLAAGFKMAKVAAVTGMQFAFDFIFKAGSDQAHDLPNKKEGEKCQEDHFSVFARMWMTWAMR